MFLTQRVAYIVLGFALVLSSALAQNNYCQEATRGTHINGVVKGWDEVFKRAEVIINRRTIENRNEYFRIGDTSARPVVLPRSYINRGVPDAEVDIPRNVCGRSSQVVGLSVRVCDGDARPNLSLPRLYVMLVHRNGASVTSATVDVTVYCDVGMDSSHQTRPKVEIHYN